MNMDIKSLRNDLSQIDDVDFVGGVSTEAIALAEAELCVSFPPGYKSFLQEFGSGYVSSEGIVGLGGPKHHDVVWLTKELRGRSSNQLPCNLIPIRNDGFGNYDCINISKRAANGEYQIVEYLHEGSSGENRKLADNFLDWFREILQIVRQIDSLND
jgi:cell wall assembly regulator SMI1